MRTFAQWPEQYHVGRAASLSPSRAERRMSPRLTVRPTSAAPFAAAGPGLTMSRPGDYDEQAAEQAAQHVLRMPGRPSGSSPADPLGQELQGKGSGAELEDIEGLTQERAAALIMAARAPLFAAQS